MGSKSGLSGNDIQEQVTTYMLKFILTSISQDLFLLIL